MTSEESGIGNNVPMGRMKGVMHSVPRTLVSSLDTRWGLGSEELARQAPPVPEGQAECGLG